jgi:hypothetical protein
LRLLRLLLLLLELGLLLLRLLVLLVLLRSLPLRVWSHSLTLSLRCVQLAQKRSEVFLVCSHVRRQSRRRLPLYNLRRAALATDERRPARRARYAALSFSRCL